MLFGRKPAPEPDRLNPGTNEEIEVVGYVRDQRRTVITTVLTVLSGGLLLLLLTWRPSIRLWFTHRACSLDTATKIICKDIYNVQWEEEVADESNTKTATNSSTYETSDKKTPYPRYFINKNIKYVWDDLTCLFTRLRSRESCERLNDLYRKRFGLSSSEANRRYDLYGENYMKIEVLSIMQLIVLQIRNPFYVFQLYTIVLWCAQEYFIFSACIAILSVVSVTCSVWETRKQSQVLRQTMTSQSEMHVIRNDTKRLVSSREVVPGDVMVVEAGAVLEVDVVVVEGAVVVTEAALTGESVPITKVGINNSENLQQILSQHQHKKHLLYSGSQVLQVRSSAATDVLGIVINTGFSTCRGELVRSIIFPKPIAFHLYKDFLKLFSFFVALGFCAVAWSVYVWLNSEALWYEVFFNSLDLLTFVVPPILPATITAINVWAQRRLKKQDIFCISSNYISLAGPVDVVCFDKTGTLTQDTLELAGAIACDENGRLSSPVNELHQLSSNQRSFAIALASCHTLTTQNINISAFTTNLMGHPLDLKIFSSLKWELEIRDDGCVNQAYGINTPLLVRPCETMDSNSSHTLEVAQLKVFPFESNEQRMTVVAQKRGRKEVMVFVKGAPEVLAAQCDPNTVPASYERVLTWYALQGLRVLAVAGATLKQAWHQVERASREELECNMRFLGLVLFHNPLKPETPLALELLQQANIETLMITGDNLATAISVARECGLVRPCQQVVIVRAQLRQRSLQNQAVQTLKVTYHHTLTLNDGQHDDNKQQFEETGASDPPPVRLNNMYVFALDGHCWQLVRQHDRSLLARLAYRGRVFARMKPQQKVEVVEELRDLGHQVAMCGDGCNDCGALKVAHVGISLSPTEASVAAPFTSIKPSIDCVAKLIAEGRSTLISTYASFKYNICYCFAALILVMMHFTIQAEPSDTQYVIMDLVLITVPSLVLGNTAAQERLVAERPTTRIIHPLHIISILSFLALQTVVYWICWVYTTNQPWFVPYVFTPGKFPSNPSYENTATVIVAFYTFIIAAVVFSHGRPFRKPFYTNRILTAYLVISLVLCLTCTFTTAEWFNTFINFRNLPHAGFRTVLFIAVIVNGLVCYIWERYLLYGIIAHRVLPWISSFLPPPTPHQQLAKELEDEPDWPPLYQERDYRISESADIKEDDVAAKGGQKGWDSEDVSDEETTAQVLMMRKLSKRRRFTATVRYVSDTTPQPLKTTLTAKLEQSDQRNDEEVYTVPDENAIYEDISEVRGKYSAVPQSDYEYNTPISLHSNIYSSASDHSYRDPANSFKSPEILHSFSPNKQKPPASECCEATRQQESSNHPQSTEDEPLYSNYSPGLSSTAPPLNQVHDAPVSEL